MWLVVGGVQSGAKPVRNRVLQGLRQWSETGYSRAAVIIQYNPDWVEEGKMPSKTLGNIRKGSEFLQYMV